MIFVGELDSSDRGRNRSGVRTKKRQTQKSDTCPVPRQCLVACTRSSKAEAQVRGQIVPGEYEADTAKEQTESITSSPDCMQHQPK